MRDDSVAVSGGEKAISLAGLGDRARREINQAAKTYLQSRKRLSHLNGRNVTMRAPLLFLLVMTSTAYAGQCDCQKIVGQCTGAIDFIKSYGSKPSFGAEIEVHSSEKVCSKVEYYVAGTPHQTLLVNKNKEAESLFGTSPITQKSVTYRGCYVCSQTDKDANGKTAGGAGPKDDFSGTWTGSGRNSFGFSQDMTVTVSPAGGNQYQISQSHTAGGTVTNGSGSGTATGKVLSYSVDGGTISCSLTLTSATSVVKKCSGWLTSNEATLTKH
ncbi:hypothetical protein [Pseudomonas guariconensis]|uniref:hypothetical protein n=1 Tax=Pseudomonas guariconensis TaxID=1288410 RepID=UPI001113D005|nr:hypothetical protein [Pseudomonas guariconensis]